MTAASGSFSLKYTKRAQKDIQQLDKIAKRRLAESLDRFRRDPLLYAVKLTKSGVEGEYRFRVGNYRVLFNLNDTELVIMRVAHRSEVYKR